MLKQKNIKYIHLKVEDFYPPTKKQLIDGVKAIESNKKGYTLVYCGYGQGRTGTMITAWEILTKQKSIDSAIKNSTAETSQQEAVLKELADYELLGN